MIILYSLFGSQICLPTLFPPHFINRLAQGQRLAFDPRLGEGLLIQRLARGRQGGGVFLARPGLETQCKSWLPLIPSAEDFHRPLHLPFSNHPASQCIQHAHHILGHHAIFIFVIEDHRFNMLLGAPQADERVKGLVDFVFGLQVPQGMWTYPGQPQGSR
jgi:hypothetical protein